MRLRALFFIGLLGMGAAVQAVPTRGLDLDPTAGPGLRAAGAGRAEAPALVPGRGWPGSGAGLPSLREVEARLEASLRGPSLMARAEQPIDVVLISTRRLDLSGFDPRADQFVWPAGEQVALARLRAGDLHRVAAMDGVVQVLDGRPPEMRAGSPDVSTALRSPASPTISKSGLLGPTDIIDAAGSQPTNPAGRDEAPTHEDWSLLHGGHAAGEAWSLGYRGAGMRIGLVDDPVDFAHPDLQDTWAVLPAGHPHAGWPQVFDPVAVYLTNNDLRTAVDTRASRTARSGHVELYQASPASPRDLEGETRLTACFRALEWVSYQQTLQPESCDFVVPASSKSGVLRYGHHPDTQLRNLLADRPNDITGRAPGILLVDEAEAGVYDTVYVDLDGDRDFTDEKAATREDPLILADYNADGLPDRSGGLLYFIADGRMSFPGGWLWNIQGVVPEAGSSVGILHASNYNGTQAASAIVSQGRMGLPEAHDLSFRDLPGDGRPQRTSLGVAPDARLVSIGPLNYGRLAYEAGWRYGLLGHDPDRVDDDLQVLTYPRGQTHLEDDGWDIESRSLDHYLGMDPGGNGVQTSFVYSTGASGPGYGTGLGPMPARGIGVAAATHYGSTGWDSVNSTLQLTHGDVAPFSNRGPGAEGRGGPDLAAEGAYMAGAWPLNLLSSQGRTGSQANQTHGSARRAAAVVAGAAALVHEAFQESQGRPPTRDEVKAILMAGARDAGQDGFTAGAGVLDTADAVRIAAGSRGLYAEPSRWAAGGYRGKEHPGFTPLSEPGDTLRKDFTLHNPSATPLDVVISARSLQRISTHSRVLSTDSTTESYQPAVPNYLQAIPREMIPADADLMLLRARMPLEEFDVNADQRPDNRFQVGVIQHTDLDGDGLLWEDQNGNGSVNSLPTSPLFVRADWGGVSREMRALEGTFTRPLDEEGIEADLAHYGMACLDETGAPSPPEQELSEKIALVERGTCTFYEKISNARTLGAVAVIVYSDERETVAMGSEDGDIDMSAVMIDRAPGLAMRDALRAGETVRARMQKRGAQQPWGLDGTPRVSYLDSEIDGLEFMRLNFDSTPRHHFEIGVHHPLERYSDGLYTALWHPQRNNAITDTQFALTYEFYGHRPWAELGLSETRLTIPAGQSATFQAWLQVPEDQPPGALQGAIFVDYARPQGEPRLQGPGGYEREDLRLTIPVHTHVMARYDGGEAVYLGGPDASSQARYDNGALYGGWAWGQRSEPGDAGGTQEAGDWRFFFIETAMPSAPGMRWLLRSSWQDDAPIGQADVDARVYAPVQDRFTDPDDPSNGAESWADPEFFGPHGMSMVARSTDVRAFYTGKPFDTTTGANLDWFQLEPSAGLHEVALQNVRFSGAADRMPFDVAMGGISVSPGEVEVQGAGCATVSVTSQLPMNDFAARGFGPTRPRVYRRIPASQDDPNDRTTAGFKQDVVLTEEAARFVVRVGHDQGDNIDIIIMRDADGDGVFAYPAERVVETYSGLAVDQAVLEGFQPAGHYQIWAHGRTINNAGATFDLIIDLVSGDALEVRRAPSALEANVPAEIEVCVNPYRVEEPGEEARGLIFFGPASMPNLLQSELRWLPGDPLGIFLPLSLRNGSAERP